MSLDCSGISAEDLIAKASSDRTICNNPIINSMIDPDAQSCGLYPENFGKNVFYGTGSKSLLVQLSEALPPPPASLPELSFNRASGADQPAELTTNFANLLTPRNSA